MFVSNYSKKVSAHGYIWVLEHAYLLKRSMPISDKSDKAILMVMRPSQLCKT